MQQKCPELKCIVFNSQNAKKLFDGYLKQEKNEAVKAWLSELTNNGKNVLPSTSPANARKKPEEKLKEWKAAEMGIGQSRKWAVRCRGISIFIAFGGDNLFLYLCQVGGAECFGRLS